MARAPAALAIERDGVGERRGYDEECDETRRDDAGNVSARRAPRHLRVVRHRAIYLCKQSAEEQQAQRHVEREIAERVNRHRCHTGERRAQAQ